MASGHGVDKPDKGDHPRRKVHKEQFGGTTADPDAGLSNDEWLRKMMKNYGHGGI